MEPDTLFLTRAGEILTALRERSLERGHPMLAALVEIARIEAADALATAERAMEFWARSDAITKRDAAAQAAPPTATAA